MQPIQTAPSPPAPSSERRSAPRVRVTYRVELKSGTRRLVGHTSDVGAWGMFVETREELEPGSKVRLSLAVGASAHDLVEAHGVVVRRVRPEDTARTGEPPGLGIEIERFLWGRRRFLEAYDRLLEQSMASRRGLRLVHGRCTKRASVGIPIYWGEGDGAVDRAGFITNLSKSGAFFVEAPPVPPGTRLHLWFEVPIAGAPRRVKAIATVVRVVGDDGVEQDGVRGMGVRLETSTLDAKILEDFLDDRLEDPERRAGVRRHREAYSTDIDGLFLEALEELDAQPRADEAHGRLDEAKGLRRGERRYRLVEMEPETRLVDWSAVGSLAFKAGVVMALGVMGMTLMQVLALL